LLDLEIKVKERRKEPCAEEIKMGRLFALREG
jgi:hypothetical protein